ncbi:NAD(P)-binding domain-containing protein [Opitutia bacterium ISCC 51]|nr:NAD(P)-binding domain-containing protein [Opitutae bacterium ISCC 51]QXD26624.1 NAD(P)-binding domain-containing protein [Opitutae bacterium ISCC 52]
MNFCVLGADAWGTALAIKLIQQGHSVTLVPDQMDAAMELASSRVNSVHLLGCTLPLQLQIGFEVKPVLMEADVVVLAVPSEQLRSQCEAVASYMDSSVALKLAIVLGPGFEDELFVQLGELVETFLPGVPYAELTTTGTPEEIVQGKADVVRLSGSGDENFLTQVKEAIAQ